jgi:hypothetical protein
MSLNFLDPRRWVLCTRKILKTHNLFALQFSIFLLVFWNILKPLVQLAYNILVSYVQCT